MPLRQRAPLLVCLLGGAFLAAPACSPDVSGLFGAPDGAGGVGGAGGAGVTSSTSTTGTTTTSTTTTSTTTTSTTTTSSTSTGGACGDGDCGPGETAESCPADCAPPCAHAVCQTGDPLDAACDACAGTVCAQDPYCCDTAWDGPCVGAADAMCGAGCCGDGACDGEACDTCPQDCGVCPPPPTCGHSACEAGPALDPTQCDDPCIEPVCMAMPSCCMGNPPDWNGACGQQADMLCGADPCVTAVCQAMPECCAVAWTAACVAATQASCGVSCGCEHPICADGPALNGACDPCAQAVCAVDTYCCETAWDGYCVGEVETICGVTCN